MSIILASQSPRRKQLLSQLGLRFETKAANIDETMSPDKSPADEVMRVSAAKARAIAAAPDDIVISADTIVVLERTILGKPKDEADAARMLRLLSGKMHTVMTALTVRRGDTVKTQLVQTHVWFRELTDGEIARYIATGDPMDKAGSYGVQGLAAVFVEKLEGDYFCVMGLPLCTLCTMLGEFGVTIV